MTEDRVCNDALKQAVTEAGWSYEQLARAVRTVAAECGDSIRTSKSTVSQWVSGSKRPTRTTARYVAEALSRALGRTVTPADVGLSPDTEGAQALLGLRLGSDPVDMLRRLGEADINRRDVFTSAAYSVAAAALPLGVDQALEYQQRASGRRAGQLEVSAVRDMLRMYVAIDERHGGQHGRSAVVQYLRDDVAPLCRAEFASSKDHRAMLSAAAAVAYLAGWKAYDGQEHGLAQRYYLQALQLTREADDHLHGAFILRILAHNGMDLCRPEHTLDLAEAALARVRGRVSPVTEALFVVTRARALANAGRGPDAVRSVRMAQDLVLRGEPDDLPYWAALWGSPRGTVASHTAKTFKALSDHRNAERHYAASARSRGAGYERITALTLAAQGREQAAQGYIEQACGTWGRSVELLEGVRSARATKEVANIRSSLAGIRRRGVRAAVDLDERARVWQAAHA
ncbi:helix-turn-helix domain-containing protein [Streptomyces sp. WMMC897]|uniref:helix-turn-helix domain-containing protein n=1 Tax=Streptomyces sp. WMMC897 TaxID=3014782 RepID=UPI0022B62F0D|nr:helix-turn-helix transcriptional regulator [Streptomyces sp. WMMC897]MCZ7413025.1 helix-turn-helix transcriptional regulator [Streptomyces sp. WMMC897]MCZ7413093.1 helix-turn-helix transcriptional regulator [Streptomyces sp. WMMC897]MCZ7415435.1 helix-turn-helix transcriptional regulator [Streptomyces sp. WMMC897]